MLKHKVHIFGTKKTDMLKKIRSKYCYGIFKLKILWTIPTLAYLL